MTPDIRIRPAEPRDADAIAAIYNAGIRRRTATFETRPRTGTDILAWLGEPRHPVLVAEQAVEIAGWASAFPYRLRACYAGIAEISIYIAEDWQGRGIGTQLLLMFIDVCEVAGLWKLVSRIFVENAASRALCQRCGFREVGIYEKHGQLDGVWRDVVIVERLLPRNLT